MKNIMVFITFLLIGQLSVAQQTGIQGSVKDKANAEELPFVTIKVFQKGKIKGGAHSDFEGNYKILNLEPGKYKLEVSYAGYETKEIKKVKIKGNKILTFDVLLAQPVREEIRVIQYNQPLFTPDTPPIKSQSNNQQASIKGTVTDAKSGELLLYATVALYQGEQLIAGGQTDFDGNYILTNIDTGIYDLQVSYAGYQTARITGVLITKEKTLVVNFSLIREKTSGRKIIVISCGRPLIYLDMTTSGRTYFAEEIDKLPIKN